MPSVDPTRDFLRTPLVCMTRPRLIRELCDSDLNVRFATSACVSQKCKNCERRDNILPCTSPKAGVIFK